jgi:tRNA dimethylallyltransferase
VNVSKPLLAIVGPTAVGKSALAMRLAPLLDSEIVSADSRQVYRYMDIGTAKPSAEERARVVHHMLDLVDPDEEYSLALFLRRARAAIQDIRSRGRLPVVVGGTGQYVRALLEGWDVPEVPPDATLRAELEARVEREGAEALHKELAALDPEAAARLDPRNPRRVIRALEVHRRSPEASGHGPSRKRRPLDAVVVGLTLERAELYRRVDERVEGMLRAGWVGEVQELMRRGYGVDLSSMSSLGYREIARHLSEGVPLEDTAEEIKRRTRRFARQQYAWFRLDDERIRWFDATPQGVDEAEAYAVQVVGAGPGPD